MPLAAGVWLLLGSVGEGFSKSCWSSCKETVWGCGRGGGREAKSVLLDLHLRGQRGYRWRGQVLVIVKNLLPQPLSPYLGKNPLGRKLSSILLLSMSDNFFPLIPSLPRTAGWVGVSENPHCSTPGSVLA